MSKDKKNKLTQQELDKLQDLENRPTACSIDTDVNNKFKIPEADTDQQSEHYNFSNLEAFTHPEACSIDREDNSPQTCSIDSHFKGPDNNYTNSENIVKPNLKEGTLDENVNILDTYGYNVPVSEEVHKKLVEQLNELEKTFPDDEYTNLKEPLISIMKNGPYIVYGNVPIIDEAIKTNQKGQSVDWKDQKDLKEPKYIALCRCGHTKTPPFCDESHLKFDFDGTCTASNKPYNEAAKIYEGCPGCYLMDEESLCAIVRFCDPDGSCWNLIKDSQTLDKAIDETYNCCSGRLTVIKDGKKVEKEYPKQIIAVLDTERKRLGPLWVTGYIPVKSDTTNYEVRNRVTLCRCGRSYNKPFCDGMHLTCPELTSEEIKENE